MQNSLTQTIINKKQILFLLFATIILTVSIPIYYAIKKPIEIPLNITDTDIDWSKPPCNPDELSSNWKEDTHIKNINRREFVYKNTNIRIAFDKGQKGFTGDKAKDHWHRYNPNGDKNINLYLDQNGNIVPKGAKSSHIKTNCK